MASRQWTPAQDALMIQLRARNPATPWRDVALVLAKPSGSACRARLDLINARKGAVSAAARKTRPCMTCSKPFESEGFHNRMCDDCRYDCSGASIYEGEGVSVRSSQRFTSTMDGDNRGGRGA